MCHKVVTRGGDKAGALRGRGGEEDLTPYPLSTAVERGGFGAPFPDSECSPLTPWPPSPRCATEGQGKGENAASPTHARSGAWRAPAAGGGRCAIALSSRWVVPPFPCPSIAASRTATGRMPCAPTGTREDANAPHSPCRNGGKGGRGVGCCLQSAPAAESPGLQPRAQPDDALPGLRTGRHQRRERLCKQALVDRQPSLAVGRAVVGASACGALVPQFGVAVGNRAGQVSPGVRLPPRDGRRGDPPGVGGPGRMAAAARVPPEVRSCPAPSPSPCVKRS